MILKVEETAICDAEAYVFATTVEDAFAEICAQEVKPSTAGHVWKYGKRPRPERCDNCGAPHGEPEQRGRSTCFFCGHPLGKAPAETETEPDDDGWLTGWMHDLRHMTASGGRTDDPGPG